MLVAESLSRLTAAMEACDLPLWQPPTTPLYLDALQELLWPLRVPAEVVTFWTEIDVDTLSVEPYPRFRGPEVARTAWLMSRDSFAEYHPLALIDIAYSSHAVMSVELGVGQRPGGALFQWWIDDMSPIHRCFDGIGDWVAAIATELEMSRFELFAATADQPASARVPVTAWWPDADIAATGQEPADQDGPRPLLKEIDTWPPYWQAVNHERASTAPGAFPWRSANGPLPS